MLPKVTELVETLPKNLRDVEPLSLDDKHIRLAQLLALGRKTSDIAQELGVSDGWVRTNKKNSNVSKLVNSLQEEAVETARRHIIDSTTKAATKLSDLVDSLDERVAFAASKDILNRGGIKTEEEVSSSHPGVILNFNNKSIDDLKIMIVEKATRVNSRD